MSKLTYVKYRVVVVIHRGATLPAEVNSVESVILRERDYTKNILDAIKDGVIEDTNKAIANWILEDL